MTLQELLDLIAQNPAYIIFYFTIIPIAAFMAGALSKGEAHLTPWNILFSVLIYGVCIPGIFSITLDVYFFLFEKRSIMNTDIYTQILPVVSMIITLLIIRRYVDFDYIPGFDKISGLITMIAATFGIMWFIDDRTHIYAITFLRFEIVLLIFIVLLLLIRFGWSKIFKSPARRYQD